MINYKMSVAVFLFILVLHLYRVDTSVLCNCVLVYLLVFVHFGIVCEFPYLSYFFQWFCALHHCVFTPNYSFSFLVDVLQILAAVTSSSVLVFWPLRLLFRCFGGFWLSCFCVPFSFCVC